MMNAPDLHFAFDVGHSSIGWAVLKAPSKQTPELLGCGAVIFQADDCLASQRRGFRRQRRHIRATRLRIARIKKLLAHLGVLTAEQLEKVASSSPWFLAARVLRGGAKLTWAELWDVLRWYAHNRGYDGNKAWSRHEADAVAANEDAEKVQNALALYTKYQTRTMAETWCAISGLDPLGFQKSVALPGKDRPKGQNAAFPREDIEREVTAILRAHFAHLPHVDDALLAALTRDWQAIPAPDILLPQRFRGGLLFGQLVPRFENRIIARCPMSYERVYQRVLTESGDIEKAKHEAEKQAKVPGAACVEFFRYRWAMQLANVQVATNDPKRPRRLSAEERQKVDAQIRARGYFTAGEFRKAVAALTGGAADNLKQMLLHPDAEKALVVDPVQRLLTAGELAPFFAVLPERLQKRIRGQLRRGARLTFGQIREWLVALGDPAILDQAIAAKLDAANTKRTKKTAPPTREELLRQPFHIEPVSGRAPHSREIMREVVTFIFATDRHPAEEGGPLYRSDAIRAAQLQRAIDEQTNNHLVRHRLRLLERLHDDLIKTYAEEKKERVARLTIEVNAELKKLSGKTAKQIAQDLGLRLSNFKGVAEKLETQLAGKGIAITPGLIRKARIAEDLGWTCPYTGKLYDVFDLVSRKVDKDHVVPRADRASDSLDSLVITFSSVNRMKGKRTAALFVEQEQGKAVPGEETLSIKPLTTFLKDVDALEAFKGHDDDKRRKKNRKRLLQLRDYVEKEFTPGDLTQTSQLVRLGAQALERHYLPGRVGVPPAGSGVSPERTSPVLPPPDVGKTATQDASLGGRDAHPTRGPVITSLPGAVTGSVRKSWRLLPLLQAANPAVMDPATHEVRTKTEIRDITHSHHALDACTLVFASLFLPSYGGAWELLVKRRLNADEQQRARELFKKLVEFEPDGTMRLIDFPETFKEQIRRRLAERRVVQHIPAEIRGLRAELNAWRVLRVEEDRATLRQRMRQPDGSFKLKEKKERVSKLVGLRPGKLQKLKAALFIADNFGLALDPAPEIIPFHQVWVRLRELREKNGGNPVRVIRNGMLIRIPNQGKRGDYRGVWRILSTKSTEAFGLCFDLGTPDGIGLVKGNAQIVSLMAAGLEILNPPLCGVDSNRNQPFEN